MVLSWKCFNVSKIFQKCFKNVTVYTFNKEKCFKNVSLCGNFPQIVAKMFQTFCNKNISKMTRKTPLARKRCKWWRFHYDVEYIFLFLYSSFCIGSIGVPGPYILVVTMNDDRLRLVPVRIHRPLFIFRVRNVQQSVWALKPRHDDECEWKLGENETWS